MQLACVRFSSSCLAERSTPTYRNPVRAATQPRTEPPANGSRTTPAAGQNHRYMSSQSTGQKIEVPLACAPPSPAYLARDRGGPSTLWGGPEPGS